MNANQLSTEKIVTIALSKAVKEADYKAAGAIMLPGTREAVDSIVHLRGAISKSEPYEQKVAADANPWKLLAVALSRLNQATVDSIVAGSFQIGDEEADAIKASAILAVEKIVAGTKRVIQGRITGTILWEMQ